MGGLRNGGGEDEGMVWVVWALSGISKQEDRGERGTGRLLSGGKLTTLTSYRTNHTVETYTVISNGLPGNSNAMISL